MKFSEKMNRVEEIINLLNDNQIDIDDAIKYFEEAMKNLKDCDEILKNFDSNIQELIGKYKNNEN